MKKACISFCVLAIIVFVAIGFLGMSTPKTEYLRIHVRADSNLKEDQDVKYLVKDVIVSAMLPIISDCETKEQAENCLQQNFEMLENVANQEQKKNGFSYTAKGGL